MAERPAERRVDPRTDAIRMLSRDGRITQGIEDQIAALGLVLTAIVLVRPVLAWVRG
ncbi:hypothetical protein ACIBTZ_28955 [Micromonospora sp. NPDC049460]|uniref:hypothetical protein n=1 Tax=unclassified Micromonospora TaxID=2617518 RepID=UPI00371D1B09